MRTATSFKIIATVCMLIDHAGASLGSYGIGLIGSEATSLMRIIGRISFPIFVFLIANGYVHTRNKNSYFLNLTLFAIISQVPFTIGLNSVNQNLTPLEGAGFFNYAQGVDSAIAIGTVLLCAFGYYYVISDKKLNAKILIIICALLLPWISFGYGGVLLHDNSKLNVFFTLAFGLMGIFVVDNLEKFNIKNFCILGVAWVFVLFFIIPNADYGIEGVLYVVALYLARKNKALMCLVAVFFTILISTLTLHTSIYTYTALAVVPAILLYNGKKGKSLNKYVFYGFYPGHLAILGMILIGIRATL